MPSTKNAIIAAVVLLSILVILLASYLFGLKPATIAVAAAAFVGGIAGAALLTAASGWPRKLGGREAISSKNTPGERFGGKAPGERLGGSEAEEKARTVLERLTGHRFPTVKGRDSPELDWLVNNKGAALELDGYCSELRVAFEYQGPHHYGYFPLAGKYGKSVVKRVDPWDKNAFCGADYSEVEAEMIKQLISRGKNSHASFLRGRANDEAKKQAAAANGVYLIVIPCTIKPENMESYILSRLVDARPPLSDRIVCALKGASYTPELELPLDTSNYEIRPYSDLRQFTNTATINGRAYGADPNSLLLCDMARGQTYAPKMYSPPRVDNIEYLNTLVRRPMQGMREMYWVGTDNAGPLYWNESLRSYQMVDAAGGKNSRLEPRQAPTTWRLSPVVP
jgi:hypothetical protein